MSKILIADDSETLRHQLVTDLEGAGYEVVQAGDGEAAVKAAESTEDLKLIVLDLNMPKLNGLEVVKALREKSLHPDAFIFMLTTDSGTNLKEQGKSLGVKAWITKPYQKAPFLNVVGKVLST